MTGASDTRPPFEPWMVGRTVVISRPSTSTTPAKTTVGTLRAFEIRYTPAANGQLVPTYHWLTTGYSAWTPWLAADQFTLHVPMYD